jgi:hypothetical protein
MRPSSPSNESEDTVDSRALSSPRNSANPSNSLHSASASSSTIQSIGTSNTSLDFSRELSLQTSAIRSGVLRESVFPAWKDDAGTADLGSPEEMQKQDPIAAQVWKLYSRAKTQLPNAERMQNLTWRMMGMNLKRLELERQRFVTNASFSPLPTGLNFYFKTPILINPADYNSRQQAHTALSRFQVELLDSAEQATSRSIRVSTSTTTITTQRKAHPTP